jgi:hypothetical protein
MGSRRLGVKRLNALAQQGQGVTADLGPGVSGSVGHRKIMKNGNEITTEIYVDLGSSAGALVQPGTQNLVIGNGDTGENAFLTKVTTAENGVVTLLEMTCVENAAGGDNDIDLSYSANKLAYSGSSGITQLINMGAAVIGKEEADLLDDNVLADKYLYLTTAASTDGATGTTYTGGKLLIRLYGHAVPSDL